MGDDYGYTTLTEADRLRLAEEVVRNKETDHYRLSFEAGETAAYAERIAQLEQEIDAAVARRDALRSALEIEQSIEAGPEPTRPDPAPDEDG